MTGLARQLGFYSATALVVSNMIGTGIFATTGFMVGDLGSAQWILLAWLIGGVCAFCGALTYAELGINFPRSGGEYVYLTEAYGQGWGFISGWISFFAGFSAPIAAAALAFADYTATFVPALRQGQEFGAGAFTFRIGGAQLLAAGLIALCTLLNCFGIRRVARVQNFLTGTKLVVILAFVVLALLVGRGSWAHFSQATARTSPYALPIQFVISLLWVMVSYSGWNAATYVAEEIRDPQRTLPRALAVGTGLVLLLYVALNLAFIYAVPLADLKGVISVGSLAATNLFGARAGTVFAALMAVAIISTVNAMVTIGPRVYFAMAREGAFIPAAARLHPRWQTPVIAIVCQGLCAILMTFTSFPQLVLYIGFSLTTFTALAVAAVFRFRRRADWQRLPALERGYPVIPALYVLVSVAMVIWGLLWQPLASTASLLTIAAGAFGWRLLKGK
ncbi:MAG: amino acid permease [Acidobacteria bacterium]|nr:amino acid permease [Acidobacteriota bacterium]